MDWIGGSTELGPGNLKGSLRLPSLFRNAVGFSENPRHAAGGGRFVAAGTPDVELRCALALFAVMIGKEHPVNLLNAEVCKMFQDGAVPEINQESGVTRTEHPDIAGVRPFEEIRQGSGVGLVEGRGKCGGAQEGSHEHRVVA